MSLCVQELHLGWKCDFAAACWQPQVAPTLSKRLYSGMRRRFLLSAELLVEEEGFARLPRASTPGGSQMMAEWEWADWMFLAFETL